MANNKEKRISAVIALSGSKRYDHFIKVAADEGRLWGLFSDGWALAGDEGDERLFPVWPTEDFAALCANGVWRDYVPEEIDIQEFLDELLPRLREDSVKIAVFMTPEDRGVVPTLEQIEADLRTELARYE